MSKSAIALCLSAAALAAGAASARPYDRGYAPQVDWNSHWLDYKTDLSEAKRELRKDLARANDRADVVDAYAEYHREVADARHDYDKEMAERGYRTRRGSVSIEGGW